MTSRLTPVVFVVLAACAACTEPDVPTYVQNPGGPTVQIATTLKISALSGSGATAHQAVITASLRDQDSHGIPDVMLTLTTSKGTIEPAVAKTNSNGDVRTTVTNGTDVRVTVSGAGLTNGVDVSLAASLSVGLSIARAEKNIPTKLEANITGDATAPLRFAWNFGDGQVAQTNVSSIVHTWAEDGQVTVSVSVTDAIDRVGTTSTLLSVRDNPEPPPPPTPPQAPTPSLDVGLSVSPLPLIAGQPATLTAVVTPHNSPPPVTSFDWDCTKDGTIDGTTAGNTFQCTYTAAGAVTAQAIAHAGTVTGTGTLAITVGTPPPPSITVTLMATPNFGQVNVTTITLTASATPQNGAGPVLSYDWDFDGNGSFDTTTTTTSVGHIYLAVGTVTTKVRANSTTPGLSGTGSVVVAITP